MVMTSQRHTWIPHQRSTSWLRRHDGPLDARQGSSGPLSKPSMVVVCCGLVLLSAVSAYAERPWNGLPINGLPFNGLPMNGIPLNGLPFNGITTNGVPLNGAPINGITLNGTASQWAPCQ